MPFFGNAHCPCGKAVTAGVVAICKNHIVHFSNAKNVAAFEKDPAATVAKLKLD